MTNFNGDVAAFYVLKCKPTCYMCVVCARARARAAAHLHQKIEHFSTRVSQVTLMQALHIECG